MVEQNATHNAPRPAFRCVATDDIIENTKFLFDNFYVGYAVCDMGRRKNAGSSHLKVVFMKRNRLFTVLTLTILSLLACNLFAPAAVLQPTPTITRRSPTAIPILPTATPAPTVFPPDLSIRPLAWFAPLPPMPTSEGRPYTGSDDFMQLFEPDAPWAAAAGHVQVFKLYGEWVAYHATDAQLRQVVADLNRRGLALAVEVGPLTPPAECGAGVESFAGIREGRNIARRIAAAGRRHPSVGFG